MSHWGLPLDGGTPVKKTPPNGFGGVSSFLFRCERRLVRQYVVSEGEVLVWHQSEERPLVYPIYNRLLT